MMVVECLMTTRPMSSSTTMVAACLMTTRLMCSNITTEVVWSIKIKPRPSLKVEVAAAHLEEMIDMAMLERKMFLI